jgi:membrane peptidoglycan carboxypeptidase
VAQSRLVSDARRRLGRHRLAAALALGVAALAAVCAGAWLAAPSGSGLAARVDARVRAGGGHPVALDRIAPIMRQAVVATEDERFYHHHGIDLIGVLRALPYDVTHLSLAQGASTITEQLAKVDYLGGNDHNPWRKLEDAALALELENHYTKEQLLAAYLNSAYFGHGAYGIQAASERYFGVEPGRLALPQAALLAGLIQAPSADDPTVHPAAARERQVEVLRSLVRDGVVTGREAAAALARPLPLRGARPLPPLGGVSFAAPPAFVWWQLIAGLTAFLGGVAALLALRRYRHEPAVLRAAVSVAALAIVVLGAVLAVRAFRAA